ncbi:GGDEF domain-containing protein [Undibacterium squillarum]|uniref:GGDEF domain-containing protein n=1 Tax=Undibacterium squillarum TaxID=1131567 RepID=UPI0035B3BC2B
MAAEVSLPSAVTMADILNAVSVGLIVVDQDQNVTFWNGWIEKHSGVVAADAVGKRIDEAFSEAPGKTFLNAISNLLQYRLPVVLSNALHRAPLPLFSKPGDTGGSERLHQSITLSPLVINDQGCCLIQVTDATTSIKREKILRSHSELLRKEATTDGLTGIYNRRFFDEHFKIALGNSHRQNTSLSVFMVDIDFFKEYNDHYGHVAGDKTLIQVAATLRRQLMRASDVVARFGGEEFVLMLPNMAEDAAYRFAEKLRLAIWELNIPHEKSRLDHRISISVGFSHYQKMENTNPDELLNTADHALYEAKHRGRNQTCFMKLPAHPNRTSYAAS